MRQAQVDRRSRLSRAVLALALVLLAWAAPLPAAANDIAIQMHRKALDESFAKLDLAAARAYLQENEAALKKEAPGVYESYMLQTLLWEGKDEEALVYRDRVLTERPKLAEDGHFKSLQEQLNNLATQPMKLLLDYEMDGNQRGIKQLEHEGQTLAMHRRIREIMAASRDQLVLSKDPWLFPGSAAAYRQVFAKHQADYDAYLTNFLEALQRTSSADARKVADLHHQLSLKPTGQAARTLPPGKPAMPKMPGQPVTVAELVDGNAELHGAFDTPDKMVRAPQLGPPALVGDLQVLQTSRHLVALRDGQPAWQYLLDPSRLEPEADEERYRHAIRVMSMSPAATPERVVARLLTADAFHLFAFDAADGRLLWEHWPDEYSLCSDPVVWRDRVLVMGRKRITPVEYYLLSFDLETGAMDTPFYLYAASREVRFVSDLASIVYYDHFMPRPTIDRDIAYLGTNAGLLYAVDLNRNSALWARRYPSIKPSVAPALAELPMQRHASPAVVGTDTVLFAPVDSLNLLLLDRLTGELRTTGHTRQWSAIHALPPNRALMLTPDAKELTVLDLSDLSEQSRLSADTTWAVASDAAGRPLLQRDQSAGLLETDFKAGPSLPEGMQLLAMGPTRPLLARRIPSGFQIASAGLKVEATDPALLTRVTTPRPELTEARFETVGGRTYAVGDNAVIQIDGDLRPTWSCGISEKPKWLLADGDRLLMVFQRHALSVDVASGRVLRSWPAAGERWRTISAAAEGSSGPMIGMRVDAANAMVMRWNHGEPTVVGTAFDCEYIAGIFDDGKSIIGERNWSGAHFVLDPDTGKYSKVDDKRYGIDRSFRHAYGFFLEDGSYVFGNDYEQGVVFTGTAFERFDVARKGTLNNHGLWYYLKDDVIRTSTWDDKPLLTLVDLRARKDLTIEMTPLRPPYIDDERIVGFSSGNKSAINGWTYDRLTGTKMEGGELLLKKGVGKSLEGRHHRRTTFHLKLNDTVYTAIGGRSESGRLNFIVVAQGMDMGTGEGTTFPGFRYGRDAMTNGKWVLFTGDETLLRISAQQFKYLVTNPEPLKGYREKFEATIDGFPDEWSASKFVQVGKNRIAVSGDMRTTKYGIDIRDPELIERLCQPGAMEQLHIVLGPGDGLVPSAYHARQGGILCAPLLAPHEDFKGGYSVSPSADRLFIELEFQEKESDKAKWARFYSGASDAKEYYGDVSIDLQLPLPDGRSLESLLAPHDPSDVPRFIMPK